MKDYYVLARKLVNLVRMKLDELTQQQGYIIVGVPDVCADLELALYLDITDRDNNVAGEKEVSNDKFSEKIEKCKSLHTRLEQSLNSVELMTEIFSSYKVKCLIGKTASSHTSSTYISREIDALEQEDNTSSPNECNESKNALFTEADRDELINCGYTSSELNSYLSLGANALVLKKMSNPKMLLSREQSIAVIKTCVAMGDANQKLSDKRPLILFIGNTGSGKSTAINYLHGCKMVEDSESVLVSHDSPEPEIMAIGHTSCSKTFLPQIIDSKNTGLVFCDCPGFEDNRGPEINIANNSNLKRLLKTVESLRIILFISYESVFTDRGKAIGELKEKLSSLFGGFDSLQTVSKSILIGITKVPAKINGKIITIQLLRDALFKYGYLPEALKLQTHIVDPLDINQPNFAITRQEWLEQIKQLSPVEQVSINFHTVLDANDKLFLADISKEVANKITDSLKTGKLDIAITHLSLLVKLRIIASEEIELLVNDNLQRLARYLSTQEQKIFELSGQAEYQQAEKKLNEMKKLISSLRADFPEFNYQVTGTDEYLWQKKVEKSVNEISGLFNEFRDQYYRSSNIALLSCAIVQIIPAIQSSSTSRLVYVLTVLAQFKKIPELDQLAEKISKQISDFTNNYFDHENILLFSECIQQCAQELENFFMHARQIYQDCLREKITMIDLIIGESVRVITDKIIISADVEEFLSKLVDIEKNGNYEQLQKLLNKLIDDKIICFDIQLLSISLSYLFEVSKLSNDEKALSLQIDFVQFCLFDLKSRLEVIKNKKDQEALTEQRRQLELEKQLQQEKELAELQASKLNELDNLIKQQQVEIAESEEREKQIQLQFKEMQRTHEELAKKALEQDKIQQHRSLEKILADTDAALSNAMLESARAHRVEQQTKIQQQRQNVQKLRQESHEKLLKKRQQFNQLRRNLGYEVEDFAELNGSKYVIEKPELSIEEIEAKVKNEMEDARAKQEQKKQNEKQQNIKLFEEQLAEIEQVKTDPVKTTGEIFKRYQSLEKNALQLRQFKFFQSRADFFHEHAQKEADMSSQIGLYRYALRDYKKALDYCLESDIQAVLSQRIKNIEDVLVVETSKRKTAGFFTPQQQPLEQKLFRKEDLTPEQLQDYEKVKAALHRLVTTIQKA